MKSITFTNSMSSDLMQWMEKYSSREKLTRRAVIEKALTDFRKSVRRKDYADSFRRASLDPEMKSMAEDGMGDYFKQLIYLEQ
ncbi:hypothetical protein A3A03_02955 [Candidatus Nomurabacteria bacterium RIFCSPLOWO2_01_FULL_40_18]|uniref:Ribbon-helix-helix protein CopG domain-containing protein n=1 Tax=Candidatus Nomurabacteria bacterium RIFCSPLOWO2_01_FULL_40_18 TaxID=1801773 RepID=A0A1F6XIM9_9BACT|nr:MAG: hypothetical protein A3A03_02955 [Candidatus Nomurabacteria bacterium RIFCSPLOWO2_01_FULL_40_18]